MELDMLLFKHDNPIVSIKYDDLKMYFSIVVTLGIFILVKTIINQFFLGLLSYELPIKWFDIKHIKYPFKENKMELIVGMVHQVHALGLSIKPFYLKIKEKGLYLNVMIIGSIGSGKSIAFMSQFLDQFIYKHCRDEEKKPFILVLDVKGNFWKFVDRFAREAERLKDVIYIENGGEQRLNFLHKPHLPPNELAHKMKLIMECFRVVRTLIILPIRPMILLQNL